MATRSYSELSARVRQDWGTQARLVAERLGAQLDAELSAQEALGGELRAAREQARLTQAALASLAGVQQAEISRIERGMGNPTRDTLLRLTSAVGRRLAIVP